MDSSLRFLLKFGEKDHIEEFASGILYCSNAVTFWGIEDKLKIKGQGDILEAGVKTFAQRMAMQENETGEITVIDMPVNAIAHIDPAKHIPVFCMFAVFDDNCEITSEGSLKIKLPAETKATIREHFPNADSVAVISNPEQFIEDVEKSIGHRMEHECVHYFHIDKGLKIENSDQTAMDMEYMKYLMQDTPPKVEKGKTTYSFAAKYAYRVLFCKDVFFEREQEYRLVLPEETIYKSTKYPVKRGCKIFCVYGNETFQIRIRYVVGGNPKFCVTAKSGANRVKFIMGGRRVKRLPPCLQHNASGTGCQGGAIISPQPSI